MVKDFSLLNFNNYGTNIRVTENYALLIITKDPEIKKNFKIYRSSSGSIEYQLLTISKENPEGLIDFICGTKWPDYLHEFMSQAIEAIINV